jgi:hypothetical protein
VVHAFIDESQRRSAYFVSCVEVAASEIAMVRRRLRACLLPGQRRLHFVDERDHRRQQLLAEFGRQPIRGAVIAVPLGVGSEADARRVALSSILTELAPAVDHLVVESRQGRDRDDRRVIAAELRSLQRDRPLRYDHRQPFEEPGLWLPDGFAWAAGAGREWRQRLEEIGVAITRIGP